MLLGSIKRSEFDNTCNWCPSNYPVVRKDEFGDMKVTCCKTATDFTTCIRNPLAKDPVCDAGFTSHKFTDKTTVVATPGGTALSNFGGYGTVKFNNDSMIRWPNSTSTATAKKTLQVPANKGVNTYGRDWCFKNLSTARTDNSQHVYEPPTIF